MPEDAWPQSPSIFRCYSGNRWCGRAGAPASCFTKESSHECSRTTDGSDTTAIRPFHVNFPEAELADLRRRINATSWPERKPVTDASQGVQLATIQKLARYWGTEYDWRKCEARLNALPQVHHRDRRARHSFHPRPFEA